MYTEEVNKIALSNTDDKRLQTFDRITTYPYGVKSNVKSIQSKRNIENINDQF